jgi:DNA-binding response OmpR family regulator
VSLVTDGEAAYQLFNEQSFDVLVFDVMMPKKDGFTLTTEIRKENNEVPILFLTAKSQAKDVVEGFTIGGNDYLKKPFSMEELIVRIHNLLSKNNFKPKTVLLGAFTFDLARQFLQYKNEEKINITHREAHLLHHLLQNKNQVLDRSKVLKELWGDDDFFNARSMDVFITKLRKKLKKDESIQIVNVRGFGYKLICD